MRIYLLPDLLREETAEETQISKRRLSLLDDGVPKEKLKIRNLELLNVGAKVEIEANPNSSRNN